MPTHVSEEQRGRKGGREGVRGVQTSKHAPVYPLLVPVHQHFEQRQGRDDRRQGITPHPPPWQQPPFLPPSLSRSPLFHPHQQEPDCRSRAVLHRRFLPPFPPLLFFLRHVQAMRRMHAEEVSKEGEVEGELQRPKALTPPESGRVQRDGAGSTWRSRSRWRRGDGGGGRRSRGEG